MKPISFKRHRFPSDVIRHAVWLYLRFSRSFRNVEELMAARGVDVSYKTMWRWTIKFGPLIARRLKKRRWPPFMTMGGTQSVMIEGDRLLGAADTHRPGALALGVQ